MGIGRASGEDELRLPIKQAINSPLLDTTIEGATSDYPQFLQADASMRLSEIDAASTMNYVKLP